MMNIKPRFEVPYERAGVITPGLPILPHGTERHPIPGGGSRALPIYKGDEVALLDREGLQPGEMVFFTPDGGSDTGKLGAHSSGRPDGIIATLACGSHSGAKVATALDKAGFKLGDAECVRVFEDGSRPGDMSSFMAESDGLLIVAAPGGPMHPGEQNPPTELILYIKRQNPGHAKGGHTPPDPLADPIYDINILPGEARS